MSGFFVVKNNFEFIFQPSDGLLYMAKLQFNAFFKLREKVRVVMNVFINLVPFKSAMKYL